MTLAISIIPNTLSFALVEDDELKALATIGGEISSARIKDNFVYLVQEGDCKVFDISDGDRPREVKRLKFGEISGLSIVGTTAYIYSWEKEFIAILDILDPANSQVVGMVSDAAAGSHMDFEHLGQLLVLRTDWIRGSETISILDRTDPIRPFRHSEFPIYETSARNEPERSYYGRINSSFSLLPTSEAKERPVACLFRDFNSANGSILLEIIELADPASPKVLGTLSFSLRNGDASEWEWEYAPSISVSEHRGFVAWGGLLWIIDLTDSSHPTLASSRFKVGNPNERLEGAYEDKAILTGRKDGQSYARLIDASDPSAPILGAEFDSRPRDSNSWSEIFWTRGTAVATIGSRSGVRLYDLTDVQKPRLTHLLFEQGLQEPTYRIVGHQMYIAEGGRLHALDFTDQKRPTSGTFETSDPSMRLEDVDGSRVCLAGKLTGVVVLDVSDPSEIRTVSKIYEPAEFSDVICRGNRIYGASDSHFLIYDSQNPSDPRPIGAYETGAPIERIQLLDSYAYLDPPTVIYAGYAQRPSVMGRIEFLEGRLISPMTYRVTERAAYVLSEGGNLEGFDLTYPSLQAPPQIPMNLIPEELRAKIEFLGASNEFVIAATKSGDVSVIDVRNPVLPRLAYSGGVAVPPYESKTIHYDKLNCVTRLDVIGSQAVFLNCDDEGGYHVYLADLADSAAPKVIEEGELGDLGEKGFDWPYYFNSSSFHNTGGHVWYSRSMNKLQKMADPDRDRTFLAFKDITGQIRIYKKF